MSSESKSKFWECKLTNPALNADKPKRFATYIKLAFIMMVLGLANADVWWKDSKSIEISDSNAWKTINSKTLNTHYAVEFYSENCKFCKTFKPDWDKMAEEFNDKTDIMISTINANKNPTLSQKYGIRAYPTIVYFVPGKSTFKYTFNDDRTYQNVRKWILECREKEEKLA